MATVLNDLKFVIVAVSAVLKDKMIATGKSVPEVMAKADMGPT